MDKIVLEVDDIAAKNWQYASEEKKKQLNITFNKLLKRLLPKVTLTFGNLFTMWVSRQNRGD